MLSLLFFILSSAFGESSTPCNDYILKDGDGANFAVIIAVGPGAARRPISYPEGRKPDEAKIQRDSAQMRADVQRFGGYLKTRFPNAMVQTPGAMTEADLQASFDQIRSSIPPIKRVLFIALAHGMNYKKETLRGYRMAIDGKQIPAETLGNIMKGTPTETILISCHSGAADLSHFPGTVFGSAGHEDVDYFGRYYEWMRYYYTHPHAKFPSCAEEFYVNWEDTAKLPRGLEEDRRITRSAWVARVNADGMEQLIAGQREAYQVKSFTGIINSIWNRPRENAHSRE